MSNPEVQDNEWMNAPMGKYSELEELQIRWESSVKAYAEKCKQFDELSRQLDEARKERDELRGKLNQTIAIADNNFDLWNKSQSELSELKLALAKKDAALKACKQYIWVDDFASKEVGHKIDDALSSSSSSLSSIVELVKAAEALFFDRNSRTMANLDDALSNVKKEFNLP